MLCPSCGQDKHPIIEGDQRGRFVYTCGNGSCHALLGPVKSSDSTPAAATSQPAQWAAQAIDAIAMPARITIVKTGTSAADVLEQLRMRLAHVDGEIEKRAELEAERAQLRRMIAAAERKPRGRKTKNNVVPFGINDYAKRTSS